MLDYKKSYDDGLPQAVRKQCKKFSMHISQSAAWLWLFGALSGWLLVLGNIH